MRKLLLSLMLLSAALLAPPSAKAQFIVVGQGCGGPGLSGIANNGTPVVCMGNPLVWTAVGGGNSVLANTPLPAASSGPGPVFNVKNYGAHGDTRSSQNCTVSGGTNLNCTDVTFTAADVGDTVSCALNFSTAVAVTTFSVFVDAHDMTMAAGSGPGTFICIFGHADDAAVTTAMPLAVAQMGSVPNSGNLIASTSAPCLYFPAGQYNLFNTAININPASSRSGFCILGDGAEVTKIYWHTGSTNVQGAAVTCNGNAGGLRIENITFDGGQGQQSFSNAAVFQSCFALVRNVGVQRFNAIGWLSIGTLMANRLVSSSNSGTGINMQGGGEIYESLVTNNQGAGLIVQNITGANQGQGTIINNSLFDENSGGGGCDVQVINSTDVTFVGPRIFSSTSGGLCGVSIDANSFLDWNGGLSGVFGSENNEGGIKNSGMLQMSGVHALSTGTSNAITNNGVFYDNGGNSTGSQFPIASGTSTGTAAVLTVTTVGANVSTNCSVGDALYVRGPAIVGYGGYYPAGLTTGITAVGTNTISYTTAGSNLGALTAGGTASCLNLQKYSGTLPKALLNVPPPNTCYVTITPITNATTFNMCNWGAGFATNITRITASSQVVTTCTTAPIITISNGTVSQTLTLTSGKQFWDSFNAQDVSTGVGTTIFKPSISATGTDRITMKYDAGALSSCTTPPTNLSVSYTIAPILSN